MDCGMDDKKQKSPQPQPNFNSLHTQLMRFDQMKDESVCLIANMIKQVEHMVVDSLVSVLVDILD